MSICATRIVAMMSTEAYQARRTIKDEKRAGTLINAAGRDAVKTAIFLDNGSVVASPLTIQRLMTAIEKSNAKGVKPPSETVRIRVYDAVDDDPDPERDEEYKEVTAEEEEDYQESEQEELSENPDEAEE